MSDKKIKMDNFERCKWNIRKYNNPTGGDPDYWHDKYAPKKHSKTYLKNKYKPKKHSQQYYKERYDENGNPRPKKKKSSQSGGMRVLEGADLGIIVFAFILYFLFKYVFK